jgi:hypothetical protein
LRDNKRRFRSRRKEYVADLERSLRELRQQGVQATKEVQLSARRVAQENVLLRDLLRQQGVDDNVVDSWIQRHNSNANNVNETTHSVKRSGEDTTQVLASQSVCLSKFSHASQLLTITRAKRSKATRTTQLQIGPLRLNQPCQNQTRIKQT